MVSMRRTRSGVLEWRIEIRGTVSSAMRHRLARYRSKGIAKNEGSTSNAIPTSTSTSKRARYTPADDAKISQLKVQGLSWTAIAECFPGRTAGAIEMIHQP
ncbi:hypothetical protein N658DRAFT_345921 [Parathielavia hyrcaniae]|uniref:Uncharacterized protein n=1 Tax=Parathielavia hyrcaniae TaxID=113614 RepID=A0AAN6PU08_9PEZI|nr:hypothetical protein N658DRAFT_345921 [Parathielavia hyrcaniae]